MTPALDSKIDIGSDVNVVKSTAGKALATFAKPCLIIGLVSAVAISVMAQSLVIACVAMGFFVAQVIAFIIATPIRSNAEAE